MNRIEINDISIIADVALQIFDGGKFVTSKDNRSVLGYRKRMPMSIGVSCDNQNLYINRTDDVELEMLLSDFFHTTDIYARIKTTDSGMYVYLYDY